ncbi:TPA: hypothetical protein H3L48_001411 [Escherichia coli]|uniref:hypothetical protein n=1 Tax=Escherichia coli TaxID=562 RepID=UPI001644EA9E|nr:hypothetical protein [Escherichia coli]MBC3324806.1 hypothetical protein [Escherichia coli]MBC9100263.1 hypothetical protein [Escherichia coli]MBL7539480.1 hypothetical protein [Escherichia coli]MBU0222189.1 hypothetical protein [Escherichia coli]MDO1549898.1 hypothetical protein [Escherichia coli]
MALVEITAGNVFAGANLRKLEVGAVVEVDDATAARWKASGKAKDTDKKKGEKLVFEVATPSAPVSSDSSALQAKLNEALEQLKQAHSDAEVKDKEHADALEQLKQAHAAELEAATKRADEAEAALTEATKKAK